MSVQTDPRRYLWRIFAEIKQTPESVCHHQEETPNTKKDRLLPAQLENHSRCLCFGSCNIVEAHDAWCIFFGELENRSMVVSRFGRKGIRTGSEVFVG